MKRDSSKQLVILIVVFITIFLSYGISYSANKTKISKILSYDERFQCQQAIEKIYWNHRIWPKENPQPKAAFETVIDKEALRAKVEDSLRKSLALDYYWHADITGRQLQSEIERIAKQTKQPEVLKEIWAALHNDPYMIAECQVRPLLADRLIRNRYAYDSRFHGILKSRISMELLKYSQPSQMSMMSGDYIETEWIRSNPSDKQSQEMHVGRQNELNEGVWKELINLLLRDYGSNEKRRARNEYLGLGLKGGGVKTDMNQLPIGEISKLHESENQFHIVCILEKHADRIKIATVTWKKMLFDVWWKETGSLFQPEIKEPDYDYILPSIAGTACIADTWKTIGLLPRAGHTAVWTGSEMIIFGGGLRNGNMESADALRYFPDSDLWVSASIINAPASKLYGTAVWTGTEMIVWGGVVLGSTEHGILDGRYNPTTDTWTPVSATNAPARRWSHTAVWTGTEMIVWGGWDCETPFNDGGKYNPSNDIWIPVATTNAPGGRYEHAAVWTGTEMIIWGGIDWDGSGLNTGGKYYPEADIWIPTSMDNVPPPRRFLTAVWTGSEMIVWGGEETNTGGIYNPVADSWVATSLEGAPTVRRCHTAVWTGDKMVIWGGYPFTDTGGIYDPLSDTWKPTSTVNAPTIREQHTAVWTGNAMIIWGGVDYIGDLNTGGIYDLINDSWKPTYVPWTPEPRIGHTTIWTGSEMIVWGGREYAGPAYNSGGRYSLATDSWIPTNLNGAPDARSQHTAVWTGYEMIIWGGIENEPFNTGSRYIPVKDIWVPISTDNAPAARYYHTAVWTGTAMIIWGGCLDASCFSYTDTGGIFYPGAYSLRAAYANNVFSEQMHYASAWKATSTINAPSGRYFHTAVWTGNKMIIWGGSDGTTMFDTGGRYDPATNLWIATSSNNAPIGRMAHTGIWSGDEMIIWGGYADGYADSGARYDPETDGWIPTTTINAPCARIYHTAVWTGTEMIIWGGVPVFYASLNSGSGGKYNPITDTWISASSYNAPSEPLLTSVWTGAEMLVWPSVSVIGARYCAAAQTAPGTVPDNGRYPGIPLTINKSGDDLIIGWGAPGGSCLTENYGLYRGTLPWTEYNHTSIICSTGGSTSVIVLSDLGSYYYLAVAQNSSKEGSYGDDSSDVQRPPAYVPCLIQDIGTCN